MTNVIELSLPTSQTLKESCIYQGIIVGYIDRKPHGIITKDEYNNITYSKTGNLVDCFCSEEDFDYLIDRIVKQFPNISFKLIKTV